MDNLFTFLYLIQSSTKLPDVLECLRSKDFVLLSFKEDTPDTTIFFPKSTWTTGRNKLREYALSLKKKYDYYIFLDEDVVFSNYSQVDGFNCFEFLINKYKPPIANPNYVGYYDETTFPFTSKPLQEAQTTIWFDGLCNAFSYNMLVHIDIFPYIDKFDNVSWWMSQYGMIMLCSIFNIEVCVFPHLLIENISHSSYPRGMCEIEFTKFAYNTYNLPYKAALSLKDNLNGKSLFKIIDFLNKYFSGYDKVNIIDVGCAIGDFKRFLNIPTINIIGIEPLIYKYKNINNNVLNTYNLLYENAIDINESNCEFNVTESLCTSSLKEFDYNNLTTDINKENSFFIPENIKAYITNVQEQITVQTITLKTVIEKNNLSNNIIHIVKIDACGNDLNVIKSGEIYSKNILFVVIASTNYNASTLYKGSTKFTEDYDYMKSQGFELLLKEILLKDDCDCLYYNTNLIKDFDFKWEKKVFKVLDPIIN